MHPTDILILFSEISVAIAGFAGIVGAIEKPWNTKRLLIDLMPVLQRPVDFTTSKLTSDTMYVIP